MLHDGALILLVNIVSVRGGVMRLFLECRGSGAHCRLSCRIVPNDPPIVISETRHVIWERVN